MTAALHIFLRDIAARRLHKPDALLHTQQEREAAARASVELDEAECRSIEAEGWEWEGWEGPGGVLW